MEDQDEVPDDWYEKGLELLKQDIVDETEVSEDEVSRVYTWLVNNYFIDYDCEKEIIYARYWDEEE